MPTPPALVERRKTKMLGSLLKSSIMSCLREGGLRWGFCFCDEVLGGLAFVMELWGGFLVL